MIYLMVPAVALAVAVYCAWPQLRKVFRGPLTPPADPGEFTDEALDALMREWGRQQRERP
jgi:hypothetical protein